MYTQGISFVLFILCCAVNAWTPEKWPPPPEEWPPEDPDGSPPFSRETTMSFDFGWHGCPKLTINPPRSKRKTAWKSRIEKGNALTGAELPFAAKLIFGWGHGLTINCGGSILNSRHILTATTCMTRFPGSKDTAHEKWTTAQLIPLFRGYLGYADLQRKNLIYTVLPVMIEEQARYPPFEDTGNNEYPDFATIRLALAHEIPMDGNRRRFGSLCLFAGDVRMFEDGYVLQWGWGSAIFKTPIMYTWNKMIRQLDFYDRMTEIERKGTSNAIIATEGQYAIKQNLSGICPDDFGGSTLVVKNIKGERRFVGIGVVSRCIGQSFYKCVGEYETSQGRIPILGAGHQFFHFRTIEQKNSNFLRWLDGRMVNRNNRKMNGILIEGEVHPFESQTFKWQDYEMPRSKEPPFEAPYTVANFFEGNYCGQVQTPPSMRKRRGKLRKRIDSYPGNDIIARRHELPFMICVIHKEKDGRIKRCGGSLLNMQHVLTAAQCCVKPRISEEPAEKLNLMYLIAGANDENDEENVQRRTDNHVESFGANEQWGNFGKLYWPEVAVYKLKKSSEFLFQKHIVEPSCLFAGDVRMLGGLDVLQAGWGKSNMKETSGKNSLKRAWSTIMEHEDLLQHMKVYFYDDFREIEDHVDGAFAPVQNEEGACEGDEGGPIMIPWRRRGDYRKDWVQIGIISGIYKHPSGRREECVGTYERSYNQQTKILPIIGVHHAFNNIRILNGEKFNALYWMHKFVGKGNMKTIYGGPLGPWPTTLWKEHYYKFSKIPEG